jgi:hypothetical protein
MEELFSEEKVLSNWTIGPPSSEGGVDVGATAGSSVPLGSSEGPTVSRI